MQKMGLILSVLLSYVGAVELAFILRDIVHQVSLHQQKLSQLSPEDENELCKIQKNLRESIAEAHAQNSDNESGVQCMQDGIQYQDGYRVEDSSNDIRDSWMHMRSSLTEQSNSRSPLPAYPSNQTINANVTKISEETVNKIITKSPSPPAIAVDGKRPPITIKSPKLDERTNDSDTDCPGLYPQMSEESSSNEPLSDHRSSVSTDMPDMHFNDYSEEYLRSLDGIKFRPLARDDGTRRRKAFKKFNSSPSSTERRQSREEELKAFTSLEEQEFEVIRNTEFMPIQYSSEPTMATKRHPRQHKRSPGQDTRRQRHGSDESQNRSPDLMDREEANDNPWGEIKPDRLLHDDELWKRERAMSIPESDDNDWTPTKVGSSILNVLREADAARSHSPVGEKEPKISLFEKASDVEHKRALDVLKALSSSESVSWVFGVDQFGRK